VTLNIISKSLKDGYKELAHRREGGVKREQKEDPFPGGAG
jgi:hypothetical protein